MNPAFEQCLPGAAMVAVCEKYFRVGAQFSG
jgi:hypothetical protein